MTNLRMFQGKLHMLANIGETDGLLDLQVRPLSETMNVDGPEESWFVSGDASVCMSTDLACVYDVAPEIIPIV